MKKENQLKQFLAMFGGQRGCDTSDGLSDIVAKGDDFEKEIGILHSWYVDAPSASFSNISAGTHWEIIVGDNLEDMDLSEEVIEEMDAGTGALYNDYDNMETWYRIW